MWRKYSWDKSGNAKENYLVTDETIKKQSSKDTPINIADKVNRHYHKNDKVDFRKSPRTWRTRKDPFEKVWDEIRLRLELAPEINAKKIIIWLMDKYAGQFSTEKNRTLQRRIAQN